MGDSQKSVGRPFTNRHQKLVLLIDPVRQRLSGCVFCQLIALSSSPL